MRFRAILMFLLASLILGCGGGGSSSGGGGGNSFTVTVPANSPSQQAVGNATVNFEAQSFSVDTNVTFQQFNNSWTVPNHFVLINSDGVGLNVATPALRDVVVEYPLTRTPTGDEQLVAVAKTNSLEDPWEILPFEQNGQTAKITVPHSELGSGRDVGSIITGAIGLLFLNQSPPADAGAMQLVRVAGHGNVGENSIILIHGLASTWPTMTNLGKALVDANLYQNAYALSYDWRLPGEQVAAFLKTQLRNIAQAGHVKSVTLLGHSYGGTIVRYTLEVLQETKATRNAVYVCSPLNGAIESGLSPFIAFLQRQQINQPYTDQSQWHGLIALSSPAALSLSPDSAYMQMMRQPLNDQRGHVNYLLIGGSIDPFVNWSNAELLNVRLEDYTSGYIERKTENVAHSTLIRSTAGNQALVSDIAGFVARSNDQLLTTDPPYQVAESHNPFVGDGWDWNFTVTNTTPNNITLEAWSLDKYDLYGAWIGQWWYNQNAGGGEVFPIHYTSWNRTLAPNQSVTIGIHTFVDINDPWLGIDQANVRYRAQTVVNTLIWRDGTGQHTSVLPLINYYGTYYWPAAYNGRAPHGPTIGNGFTLRK